MLMKSVTTIDLVLIYQQSVGKRSLHLMDTVNAKKRWTTYQYKVYMYDLYMFIRYLVSITQVLKDT
jgi:hypothetical protein